MRTALITAAALALSGCATTYDLQLMPRDSGKMYRGTAEDNGSGEGRISITIDDRTYNGTWVSTAPDRTNAYVSGGFGWGRRGGGGIGTIITMDNPQGGEAKALLTSSDGAGLRCDFRNSQGRGGGVCRDDKGREYDVQLRAVSHR
jgi:hypothetical protein